MKGADPGEDPRRRTLPPLTTHQLSNRRTAWRRRRARRRAAFGAVLLAGVLAATVAVASGGGRASGKVHGGGQPAKVNALKVAGVAHGHTASAASVASASVAWQDAVDRALRYTPYIRVGTARKREVALSFDDGPSSYTPKILSVLSRNHAPATFFVIGKQAKVFPHFVRDEVREGSEVGDHTETHPFMSLLSAATQRAQIVDAADAIEAAGAPPPSLWRPPYGAFNHTTLAILRSLRMLVTLWTVDTSDYARPSVARIRYVALSGARPGAIILMHDGGGNRSETVAALPRIIAVLRRRGFRLVTVGQLLADDPPPVQPPPTPLSGAG